METIFTKMAVFTALCKILLVLQLPLVLLVLRLGRGSRTLHNTEFYRVPLAPELAELAELAELGELGELGELNIMSALHNAKIYNISELGNKA